MKKVYAVVEITYTEASTAPRFWGWSQILTPAKATSYSFKQFKLHSLVDEDGKTTKMDVEV